MIVAIHRDADRLCIGYSSRRKYSSEETNLFCRVVNKLLKDKRNKLSKVKVNKRLNGFHNGYLSLAFNSTEEVIKQYTYKEVRDSRMEIDLNISSRSNESEIIIIKTISGIELDDECYNLFLDIARELAVLEGFNLDHVLSSTIVRKNIKVEVSTESLNVCNF